MDLSNKKFSTKKIESLIDELKELKKEKESKEILSSTEYCKYLNTHLTKAQVIKIAKVLNLKFKEGDSIDQICLQIEKEAPYIMSPRSTSLLKFLFVDHQIKTSFLLIALFIVTEYCYRMNSIKTNDYTPIHSWLRKNIPSLYQNIIGISFFTIWSSIILDLVNYFGGFTFFRKLSSTAKISMRNKVFDIIGMDTRSRSPKTLKRKIRDFFSLPGNSKRKSLKKSLKKVIEEIKDE